MKNFSEKIAFFGFVSTVFVFANFLHGESNFSLSNASYSVYAVRDDGSILIDENSDKSLTPASCMKLVTTAAALQILEERPFRTTLEYDGVIGKKILHGNLYIRGGGDPCLGSDRTSSSLSWKKQVELWADEIEKLSIKKIEGEVIGDASIWEEAMASPGWLWEDLGNYYGAGASGLSFHENFYTVFFEKGIEGEKAKILRTDPPVNGVFHNEIKIGPRGSGDNACIYTCEFFSEKFFRGTIPEGDSFSIKGSITDPAFLAASLLEEELQKRQITVLHKNLKKSKRTSFHVTNSPALKEIVYWTNQVSINLYAEHLLKKMGEKMYQEGSASSGLKAIYEFWKNRNIDLTGFNQVDGAGLSRKNLITAKQLVSILMKMKKSDHFSEFLQSLPQKEDIRAKSGTMSLVKCYAGYAGDITFAILINNSSSEKMKEEMELFFSKLKLLMK